MPTAYFGRAGEPGSSFEPSPDLLVVRAASGPAVPRARGSVPLPLRDLLADALRVQTHPEVGVEVYRLPPGQPVAARIAALDAAPEVRFAGHVLADAAGDPVLYTENLFVKFADDADPAHCRAVLAEAGLTVREQVGYAANGYFTAAPERTGQRVFGIAAELLARADVEYSHPELIRRRARKAIAPQQWHLHATTVGGTPVDAHANVAAAHAITRGSGVTVAVIDDGIDIDHPEFAGAGKVVAPRDVTAGTGDPRPKDQNGTGPDYGDNHGTACAGVAVAAGSAGASGVAPEAALLPIRLTSGLGSQAEARAFQWAADNGADVISCSWGPADGAWYRPDDPAHQRVVPIPASTRLALEYAANSGRGGRGCVIVFAAGNGNEPADNDGYASHPAVLAVAACNDTGTRSVYSDTGAAVAVAFPSNDFEHAPFRHPAPLTPGIWTVDRRGRSGYNPGDPALGDAAGDYTAEFGGTSSAAPGVAGTAALVLAVNPDLTRDQVREVLQRTADRIDEANGRYDATGRSPWYGHGRVNARAAVDAAARG
ncbi:S8 family serine peptidase [Nocardia sp. NPDC057353]|uniref:S8 family serine peptidase n=1 Tax=Nocardia sp. NPDC057353 TaxID=3346104 RepID=UPI00363FF013